MIPVVSYAATAGRRDSRDGLRRAIAEAGRLAAEHGVCELWVVHPDVLPPAAAPASDGSHRLQGETMPELPPGVTLRWVGDRDS